MHGETQADVAGVLGITRPMYTRYELGEAELSAAYVQKLAKHWHVSLDVLTGQKETRPSSSGVKIPILGKIVAGIPISAIKDIEGYEEIPAQLAACGEFFALRVVGESMQPELRPGDRVIVKAQEDVDSGAIAIVMVGEEEATIKKVVKSTLGITLVGYNVAVYEPHFYSNKEILSLPIRILGHVVEVRRDLP